MMDRFKPLIYFVISLLLFLFGSIFGQLLVTFISTIKYGYDYEKTTEILYSFSTYFSRPESKAFFDANTTLLEHGKYLSALIQLLSYLPLIIFVIGVLYKELKKDSIEFNKSLKKNVKIIILTFASMMILTYAMAAIYQVLNIQGESENESILELIMSGSGKWYLLVAVVIFAPILEEIIFRKLLIDTCEITFNLKPVFAIIISALIFAFIHVTDLKSLIFIFQYLALSVPLCLAYHFSKNNIYVSIGAHMLNNLLVGLAYIAQYGL